MKNVLLGGAAALALISTSAFVVPASADQGFSLNLEYESGSFGAAGGLNGNLGGTVMKRTNESGSGSVNEVDIDVTLDSGGIKKVAGTVHSGAYGYNENMIKTKGVGAMATGSLAGSYVQGVSTVDLTVQKK